MMMHPAVAVALQDFHRRIAGLSYEQLKVLAHAGATREMRDAAVRELCSRMLLDEQTSTVVALTQGAR